MSFPELGDFPVTFFQGSDSWESTNHYGVIEKDPISTLASWKMEAVIHMADIPSWLLRGHEVSVAVNVHGQVWTHHFMLSNKKFEESTCTLIGETSGGTQPVWS